MKHIGWALYPSIAETRNYRALQIGLYLGQEEPCLMCFWRKSLFRKLLEKLLV